MNTGHKKLKKRDWWKLSLMEQMANIGSEVERAIIWKSKKTEYSKMAYERALELMEYSIDDGKNSGRLKELTRVYEVLGDYFAGENNYSSTDKLWRNYFFPFAYAVRKDK
jgi:hypothetical protein